MKLPRLCKRLIVGALMVANLTGAGRRRADARARRRNAAAVARRRAGRRTRHRARNVHRTRAGRPAARSHRRARDAADAGAVSRACAGQRRDAAHRAGRRLCARGHRQGRLRVRAVVRRARLRVRGAALSPARGWLGRRRRRAGARSPCARCACCARGARQYAPARIGVIGFSAGGHLVARLITEPGAELCARRRRRRSCGAAGFRRAHVSR